MLCFKKLMRVIKYFFLSMYSQRKVVKLCVLASSCLSCCLYTLKNHWMDMHSIWYCWVILKSGHFGQNQTIIMDTLHTKLQMFWHISHVQFISNALNNYQCKNCLKNKLQRQMKNISHSIYFLATLTVFRITAFSNKTSVNIQGGTWNVIPFHHHIKIVTPQYRCCKRASECCSSWKMR